jgi:flagellar hook-length control protein FliK
MQTSQVSSAANVLSKPAPPAKSGESSSSAPFEQVLSREITDRSNTKDASASKDAGKGETTKTTSNAANSRESAAAAKGRQNADTEASDAANAADSDEATTAAAQTPEDMLALVANLAQLATPVTETSATAHGLSTGVEGAAAPGGSIGGPLAAITSPLTSSAITSATSPVAQRKAGTMLNALADKTFGSKHQADVLAESTGGGASGATMADLNGKGMQATGATIAATANAPDFSAVMKESAANLGATTQQLQGVQAGGVQTAQQLAASAAEKLTPRVGTSAWDQALGQKVVWMVAGEQQSASLSLNPPDLGPLQVALSVSNSQATATFTAAQPEVRQALEAALPKLREMLGEAGIQLGHASVNSGSTSQQGSEQHASQHGRRIGQTDNDSDAQVHVSHVPTPASGRGMVDTFV